MASASRSVSDPWSVNYEVSSCSIEFVANFLPVSTATILILFSGTSGVGSRILVALLALVFVIVVSRGLLRFGGIAGGAS